MNDMMWITWHDMKMTMTMIMTMTQHTINKVPITIVIKKDITNSSFRISRPSIIKTYSCHDMIWHNMKLYVKLPLSFKNHLFVSIKKT